ncbi:MAG: TIGR02677 family protein [Erysipelotrichaceae bacterium]
MKVYEQLLQPIKETTYLHVENTERYRLIIRYFFEQYENLQYWLRKEDIYQMMSELSLFSDYGMDKVQSDLQKLAEWGNLLYVQDNSKVNTISDFKNKNFRYRLSPYSVEIERMTLKLENLEIKGASLSPSLLERIKNHILEIPTLHDEPPIKVSGWWNSLSNDFMRLNHDYQDYISTLNSARADEMMKSTAFLLFKDKLITYLRTFVKILQENAIIIESVLVKVQPDEIKCLLDKVLEYELSIPRMDNELNQEEFLSHAQLKYQSIYMWFVGEDGENEVHRLHNITNEIIRKITRYAMQITEMHHRGANRKEEYRKIASIFGQCENMEEAHILSSMVFGVEHTLHFKDLIARESDSIYSSVYQETNTFVQLQTKTRSVKEKLDRAFAPNYQLEKTIQRNQIEDEIIKTRKLVEKWSEKKVILFSTLPPLSVKERKMLLSWISKALANKSKSSFTETGIKYVVSMEKSGECEIKCEDGNFFAPCFMIEFKGGQHEND